MYRLEGENPQLRYRGFAVGKVGCCEPLLKRTRHACRDGSRALESSGRAPNHRTSTIDLASFLWTGSRGSFAIEYVRYCEYVYTICVKNLGFASAQKSALKFSRAMVIEVPVNVSDVYGYIES